VPVDLHVIEGEDHVELTGRRIGVTARVIDRDVEGLTDQHRTRLHHVDRRAAELPEVIVHPWLIEIERRTVGETAVRRRIGQVGVLGDLRDHVHPEPVDAPIEPEPHHVLHPPPEQPGPSQSRSGCSTA
jgi:hypothetical protein